MARCGEAMAGSPNGEFVMVPKPGDNDLGSHNEQMQRDHGCSDHEKRQPTRRRCVRYHVTTCYQTSGPRSLQSAEWWKKMQVDAVEWRHRSGERDGGEGRQERTKEARAAGPNLEWLGFVQNDSETNTGSPWRGHPGAGDADAHVQEEETLRYDQKSKS